MTCAHRIDVDIASQTVDNDHNNSGVLTIRGLTTRRGAMVSRANLFVIATLLPAPLLAIGAWAGGLWLLAALAYLSVFAFALDELVAVAQPPDAATREFPAADGLSVVLALAHFVLLGLAVFALSGGTGLGFGDRLVGFFAFGLFFGQVSNSNAHELIHRPTRVLHGLGKWVFISHLFGHHTSAHRLVHHRDVATPDDPNSARLGQSFYHFAPRAWIGSFRRGLEVENKRRAAGAGLHPYAVYLGGELLMLVLAALIGGFAGVLVLVALATYATMQLLLSDYVQHYGLRRAVAPDGRYEAVAARHSWNAPHVFSALVMLNAPRHSDHHAHPQRKYPALELPEGCPMCPRSLPVMGFVALLPRRWRRLMDGRVAALGQQETVSEQ